MLNGDEDRGALGLGMGGEAPGGSDEKDEVRDDEWYCLSSGASSLPERTSHRSSSLEVRGKDCVCVYCW
jgi:hypothetical protein